jgi:DNA-binding LacI/PurR family transcriptional regulator
MPVGQKFNHLEGLLKSGIPLVVVDRGSDELKTSTVVVDNYSGAYEAVEHLIGKGHRRIAIIQGLPETVTASERLRGYHDALTRHGIEFDENLVVGRDFRQENGYIETKILLKKEKPPTAIFSTSDLITLGCLQALFEEGLRVPHDMSIVGFDDIDSAAFFRCPVTVVAQPKENMGELAVELLLEEFRNPKKHEPKRITLKPRLLVRESVGRVQDPPTLDSEVA